MGQSPAHSPAQLQRVDSASAIVPSALSSTGISTVRNGAAVGRVKYGSHVCFLWIVARTVGQSWGLSPYGLGSLTPHGQRARSVSRWASHGDSVPMAWVGSGYLLR